MAHAVNVGAASGTAADRMSVIAGRPAYHAYLILQIGYAAPRLASRGTRHDHQVDR
jgi:hypothetical protein